MTNRFKGLDLVDRVLEKLQTKVRKIVQEAVTKISMALKALPNIQNFTWFFYIYRTYRTYSTQLTKRKKAKWLSEEVLQITAERREVKGKGENE